MNLIKKQNIRSWLALIFSLLALIFSALNNFYFQSFIYRGIDDNKSGTIVEGVSDDPDLVGLIGLYPLSQDRQFYSELQLRSNGNAELEFDFASCRLPGCQALTIISDIDANDALNTILYLDTYTSGIPQSGLGSAVAFRTEAKNGIMETLGVITATRDKCGNPIIIFYINDIPVLVLNSEGVLYNYNQQSC